MFRIPSEFRNGNPRELIRLLAAAVLFTLIARPESVLAEPEIRFRDWKNPNGETIRARLEGLVNGQVQLRQLSDRSIIELKFQALTPEDQVYVEERAHLVWRRDIVTWPKHLRPARDFRVDELQAGRNFIYNTPHFSLRSDVRLAPDLVREYSIVFESTHYALESLPLGLQPEVPSSGHYKVRLFRRHEDFQNSGGHLETEAMYVQKTREILVPLASLGVNIIGEQVPLTDRFDPSPLKHEVTHQLMHNWLSLLPVWFAEGIAEYISAVPFSDGEFDFTRMEQGIKAHLSLKYGIHPAPTSGSYSVDVIPPEKLMSLSHADWSRALDGGANAVLNYRSSLLLLYFFIHLDGEGNAANVVDYLRTARMERDRQADFVEAYNEAVKEYNQRKLAWAEEAKRYNEALLKHREEAVAYNQRVDKYNEQDRAKLPPEQRIQVGPKPVAPTLPQRPARPEILNQDPKERFPLNLKEIEERARIKLTQNRSYPELWSHLKKALGRQQIELREAGNLH